jgi:hypothetical protein
MPKTLRMGVLTFMPVAQVAQSVEQLIRNEQVAGSIPALGSTKPLQPWGFLFLDALRTTDGYA